METIIGQALIFLPLVLGLYITYAVLHIADLTVDGSFVTGAAVFGITAGSGISPVVAVFLAVLAGSLTGIAAAIIQYKNRVDPLIAGILMSFMLYSVNLRIMGKPNIALFYLNMTFTDSVINTTVLALLLMLFLTLLLKSRYGLGMKAFGNNRLLMYELGLSPELTRAASLALGNALAALSGALTAMHYGYSDINMGIGMAIIGIAAVVIATSVFAKLEALVAYRFSDIFALTCCLFACLLYYSVTYTALRYGIDPINIKLLIGIMLAIVLRLRSTYGERG
jgi:putative ABC transport system permease protein